MSTGVRCRSTIVLAAMMCGVFVLSAGNLSGQGRARPGGGDLPPTILATLNDQVVPAFRAGNSAGLLTALSPLVQRLKVADLEAADAALTAAGVPTIAELLSGARWRLLVQNEAGAAPAAKGRELELTLTGFKRTLEDYLNTRSRHVAFDPAAPIPENFLAFERRLWDHHVLDNELAGVGRVVLFSLSLVDEPGDRRGSGLTAEVQEVFRADFAKLAEELSHLQRELELRTVRLRLARLEYSHHVLNSVKDLKDRFLAAHVVDVDGELVVEALDRSTAVGGAEVDPAFRERVVQLRDEGRRAAGEDLIAKSRALFTGLHWWYRGRYGRGPDGGGLLKSQQAMATPEGQFGLYMPIVPPNPAEDLGQNSQTAVVPRRHFYLWQFETRDLEMASQNRNRRGHQDQLVSITHMQHFY